jgi:hypothetical protein
MNQESKDNCGGVNLVSVRTCPKSYIARDCSGEVARAFTSPETRRDYIALCFNSSVAGGHSGKNGEVKSSLIPSGEITRENKLAGTTSTRL